MSISLAHLPPVHQNVLAFLQQMGVELTPTLAQSLIFGVKMGHFLPQYAEQMQPHWRRLFGDQADGAGVALLLRDQHPVAHVSSRTLILRLQKLHTDGGLTTAHQLQRISWNLGWREEIKGLVVADLVKRIQQRLPVVEVVLYRPATQSAFYALERQLHQAFEWA